ncbi:MAG: FAD-binding oxidoreductase [Rhodobacteraceae bacterium]|nr:FAD-binding oxidoreductase [Paracoccaceae bacterium]
MSDGPTVIIGAGIAGVSTALWLQRLGHTVMLIDRSAPGEGTSFGNAGVLAASSILPVTVPGLVTKIPRMLLNPASPLFVIWHRVPGIMPWLMRYLSHATGDESRRITGALSTIVTDSLAQHMDLAGGTRAEHRLTKWDYAYAYPSRDAYRKDEFAWSCRKRAGFVPQEITGDAIQDYMPGVSDAVGFLAVMDRHGFILDPGGYIKDLACEVEACGGRIVRATVETLVLESDRVRSVVTNAGLIECANVVMATGVWSRGLLEPLGVRVPMQTERGYHIEFREPSRTPRIPIMYSAGKFVLSPMSNGLRCAGVIEFGGLTPGPSRKPLKLLRNHLGMIYPDFAASDDQEWLGHRPAPTDSLPFLGEIRSTGIYTAFGHHHIGLTSGPKTGRIIANLIAHGQDIIDLEPFHPLRFGTNGV